MRAGGNKSAAKRVRYRNMFSQKGLRSENCIDTVCCKKRVVHVSSDRLRESLLRKRKVAIAEEPKRFAKAKETSKTKQNCICRGKTKLYNLVVGAETRRGWVLKVWLPRQSRRNGEFPFRVVLTKQQEKEIVALVGFFSWQRSIVVVVYSTVGIFPCLDQSTLSTAQLTLREYIR